MPTGLAIVATAGTFQLWRIIATLALLGTVRGTVPLLGITVGTVIMVRYCWHCPITMICCWHCLYCETMLALSLYCDMLLALPRSCDILLAMSHYFDIFWHCPITVICCFALSHYCPIMVRNYLSFAILLLLLYYLTHFHAGIIPLVINLEALYLHYKTTHTVCVLRDTSWYCRITVLYTLSHYRQMALMLCHHDAMSCCSESLHLVIDTSSVFVYWF